MSDTLAKICADKADWVTECKAKTSEKTLLQRAKDRIPPRGFVAALSAQAVQGGFGVIAEIKKASPSKGLIRPDFNPTELAKAYETGGASCISVLTDTPYFQGSDEDFLNARTACSLPMIRKDFMIDRYQIIESYALGADCILLILAALNDKQAQILLDTALELGMDALIEIHDAEELQRAQNLRTIPERSVIGINNRNLKTLQVDTHTCIALAPKLNGAWWVAESGIADAGVMRAMHKAGAAGFLIGESLMRQNNVTVALQNLIAEAT